MPAPPPWGCRNAPSAPGSARPPETPHIRIAHRCSPPRWEKVLADASPSVGARFAARHAQRGARTLYAHRSAAKAGALDTRRRPATVPADYPRSSSSYMAGRKPGTRWCHRHFKQRGSAPCRGISHSPADQYGSAPRGARSGRQQATGHHRQRPAATGYDRSHGSQPSRLTNTGCPPQPGGPAVPLTRGTAREQCRRRPRGRNRVRIG